MFLRGLDSPNVISLINVALVRDEVVVSKDDNEMLFDIYHRIS